MKRDLTSWHRQRVRYLFRERNEKGHPNEVPLAATQRAGVVPKSQLDFKTMEAVTSDLSLFKLVEPDDFVISLRSFEGGLEHSAYRGILSPAYTVLRPSREVHVGFFKHLLKSDGFVQGLGRHKKGIRDGQAVPFNTLQDDYLELPDTPTQERIANFLDEQTARIDALIAEKQKLLRNLDEYAQSVLTSAVTQGLNPDAEMQRAAHDWLGLVPMHWRQTHIRRVCRVITDGAHISPDQSSPDFAFVSTVDVMEGSIDFDGCLRTSADCFGYLERTGCRPIAGDVLFSKDGTIGRTAVVPEHAPPFVVASSLVILSPSAGQVLPAFLDFWLNNDLLKQNVELQLAGAALRRISVEKVSRLPMLVPPLSEQKLIVQRLDSLIIRTRELKQHVIAHQSLLKQYRSSLISAAVTGQLDLGTFDAKKAA